MKKMYSIILCFSLAFLSACSNANADTDISEKETFIQQTDIVKETTVPSPKDKSSVSADVEIFNKGAYGISYVVHSENGSLLIDNGFYDDELDEYLRSIGGIDAVLITHGHYDHIGGIDSLKEAFPEIPVYINEQDMEFLTDTQLNCSAVMSQSVVINSEVNALNEGTYEIAGYQIEVIHFPGHTRGSNFYYFPDRNLLFTGDAILPDSLGPTSRPTGSDDEMQLSVSKFLEREFPEETRVFCGHNGNTTYAELLQNNSALKGEKR